MVIQSCCQIHARRCLLTAGFQCLFYLACLQSYGNLPAPQLGTVGILYCQHIGFGQVGLAVLHTDAYTHLRFLHLEWHVGGYEVSLWRCVHAHPLLASIGCDVQGGVFACRGWVNQCRHCPIHAHTATVLCLCLQKTQHQPQCHHSYHPPFSYVCSSLHTIETHFFAIYCKNRQAFTEKTVCFPSYSLHFPFISLVHTKGN